MLYECLGKIMVSSDYIDIGVIVIILLLGLRGLKNGLIHEIMGVIGVALGIFLASRHCIEVSHYLELAGLHFQNETIIWTLAFVLILSCIWIGALVIGAIIARFIIIMPEFAIINYCGGYVFAALKYCVILCFVVYALSQVGFLKQPIKDFTKGTKSYPMMYEIAEKIVSLDSLQTLQEQYKKQQEQVDNVSEKAKSEIKKKVKGQ